ncbi:ubiquitin-conjugating enzyme/RWD-like protein [Mycena capillaripes]|nr:ubiquitin-conjugating enzyme/RWD-like protein [Mycena capillaripes]
MTKSFDHLDRIRTVRFYAFLTLNCKNDKNPYIRIDLVDSSSFHLKGLFPGPEDTPSEILTTIKIIPDSYPFQPVGMKFLTKVYYPSVSSASDAICIDMLKDAWPSPNDPQDAEVAEQYTTSKGSFEETPRYWIDGTERQ